MKYFRFLLLISLLLLASCAKAPVAIDWNGNEPIETCIHFYQELDTIIESQHAQDVQSTRISGFPFLRTNRFLTSFSDTNMDMMMFSSWSKRMQVLASQAYTIEWKNLSQTDRNLMKNDESVAERLSYCSELLTNDLLYDPAKKNILQDQVFVADNYQTWKQILGLYPIVGWAFMAGISDWHKETRQVFATPLKEIPVMGKIDRYYPHVKSVEVNVKLLNDALGIPDLSEVEKNALFEKFAPIIDIDIATHDDEIGAIILQPHVLVDTKKTVVYQHLSYTKFHGKVLLQLNYIFWFPSRPKISSLDILGGNIDGITWRVTLDEMGDPLAYDTIHNCGCYHMFFPTNKLTLENEGGFFEEGMFMPQVAPNLSADDRIVLRVEHGTHYIQRITKTNSRTNDRIYHTMDYNILRSIPSPRGYQSVFDTEGLMPNTDRLERYFFWPMGIAKPGSMRQWGNHATAFVGRRHFDDAKLLERYFNWTNNQRH